ncbi:hypothetical protein ACFYN0_12480 [Streptomyces sp. NPDC006704]|uniref:hypothetical protein n=1 Tax=Streptomyces sp. NPDC006704 TaxID=3364760 RepID=UPI003680B777
MARKHDGVNVTPHANCAATSDSWHPACGDGATWTASLDVDIVRIASAPAPNEPG